MSFFFKSFRKYIFFTLLIVVFLTNLTSCAVFDNYSNNNINSYHIDKTKKQQANKSTNNNVTTTLNNAKNDNKKTNKVPYNNTKTNTKHSDIHIGSSSRFDKKRIDIYNPYIEDIQYELVTSSNLNSVTAIGEKWIVNNSVEIANVNNIDSLLERVVYKKKTVVNESDFHAKKIESANIILSPVRFTDLKKWDEDNFDDALESFLNSCKVFVNYKKRHKNVASMELQFGNIDDWHNICIQAVAYGRQGRSKAFFEENFFPYLVIDKKSNSSSGLFTGYYEFGIRANLKKTDTFQYPVYARPKFCTKGSICPERKSIYNGILSNKGLEICWVDSPIDLWRMQLQGSGIAILPNNTFVRLSFGGGNYRSRENIFKYFDKKLLPANTTNQEKAMIKWLEDHPSYAQNIILNDPSYTFFAPNNRRFAVGGHGSGLIPTRSIAIDTRYIPYGVPMWIQTQLPVKDVHAKNNKWLELNRLTVAQDAGQSIKGVVRADVFFGHGDKATYLANHMRFQGQYYILLPKAVVMNSNKKTR